jgi:TolB protein
MTKARFISTLFLAVTFSLAPVYHGICQRTIIIEGEMDPDGFLVPIPVFITGFSPKVAAILKQDLMFMAMKSVPQKEAAYIISGRDSAGKVEATVYQAVTKKPELTKAFGGSDQRLLVHRLADTIAETITKQPGIAQKKIVFRTETEKRVSEIYVADYDGHKARAFTRDGAWTVAPCWAGSLAISYSTYKLGNPRVFYHDLQSGSRRQVAGFPGSNISPAFSRDGRHVAMILSKDGNPELYVANADGSGLKRLTRTKADESSPCWSPDGRTVLVVSRKSGKAGLYKVPITGGAMQRVATYTANATEPDWSPDGKWIIFTSLAGGKFNLYLVPSKGGRAKALTLGEDPSWAANSRAVIFSRGHDHQKRLSLLDVPTRQVKDIGRILRSNSQPSWAK